MHIFPKIAAKSHQNCVADFSKKFGLKTVDLGTIPNSVVGRFNGGDLLRTTKPCDYSSKSLPLIRAECKGARGEVEKGSIFADEPRKQATGYII